MRSGSVRFTRRLPAKERKDQTQHDANDDAGNDWEIESAVSSFNPDVAGQTSQPTRTDTSPKQNAKNDDHEAKNDEQFSEVRHKSISHETSGRAKLGRAGSNPCLIATRRDPSVRAGLAFPFGITSHGKVANLDAAMTFKCDGSAIS